MLYDISPPLTEHTAVFPGDTPLTRSVQLQVERGDPVTLSSLHSTVHVGAHIDGPNHYAPGAPGVESWLLERCIGPCQVVHVHIERGEHITAGHLRGALIDQPRVLLRTDTQPDWRVFNADFAALTPEAVGHLHAAGVELVGIDTPSVDAADSTELPSHARCRAHGMTILEGVRLEDVPEGTYELIAAPLKLVGFDASPVRAVLRSLHDAD